MHIKRTVSIIILSAFAAAVLGGCAEKTVDNRAFILKESVSLAQEMQGKFTQFIPELDPASVADFWQSLENADMSSPDSAVIVTLDPDFVADFLTNFQQIEFSDYSDELIDFFAPKTTTGLTSLVYAVLIDKGYSLPLLSTSGMFSVTHIIKAPENFSNTLVFMDFNACTAITTFSRYGDYIDCSCQFIIPDMTAEDLLDLYSAFFETSYENNFLNGHTEIIESAQLGEIIDS